MSGRVSECVASFPGLSRLQYEKLGSNKSMGDKPGSAVCVRSFL